ncbi:septin-12 isoform X2 [Dasypus novemcinctus]|nr:septin-12 isoform X2 [Dasypus novemcinctus]
MLGYVGIEAVLDQLKIKAMKMGFEFNIMVVGQSGLGKSTMVSTLFKSKVWKTTPPAAGGPVPQTLQLQSVTHVLEEKGVKLKLTVTDTPGFGDQINNDKCWDPILGYIREQYERYLQEEILITRQRHIPDTRVHCCVYFVPPTGHCLRPLDIEFLQRLCRTVNVVPVIARADSLTLEERETFRHRIQQDLKNHSIDVYPQKCFDEDINDRILNSKIRERIPFAVVGADREHLVNGSGEHGALRVSSPARPAHSLPPPGPEGHHPQRPLRELPRLEAQREPRAAPRARMGEPVPCAHQPRGCGRALKSPQAGPRQHGGGMLSPRGPHACTRASIKGGHCFLRKAVLREPKVFLETPPWSYPRIKVWLFLCKNGRHPRRWESQSPGRASFGPPALLCPIPRPKSQIRLSAANPVHPASHSQPGWPTRL